MGSGYGRFRLVPLQQPAGRRLCSHRFRGRLRRGFVSRRRRSPEPHKHRQRRLGGWERSDANRSDRRFRSDRHHHSDDRQLVRYPPGDLQPQRQLGARRSESFAAGRRRRFQRRHGVGRGAFDRRAAAAQQQLHGGGSGQQRQGCHRQSRRCPQRSGRRVFAAAKRLQRGVRAFDRRAVQYGRQKRRQRIARGAV